MGRVGRRDRGQVGAREINYLRRWLCYRVHWVLWGGVMGCQAEGNTCDPFLSYNIRNGRNGGLESELQVISQVNVDIGVFQEKNLTRGIYTRESGGSRL